MAKSKTQQVRPSNESNQSTGFLTRFIFDSPKYIFIPVSLLLLLMKTGIQYIPNIGVSQAIATHPFATNGLFDSDPNGFYQMWNWLTPFLTYVLHLNSPENFLRVHAIFAIGFLLIVILTLFKKFSNETARTAVIIFLALPVSGSVIFWITYDAPSLFLMALILFVFENRYVVFTLGILLGLQDFEPTVVGFGAVVIALALSKGGKVSRTSMVKFLAVIAGAFTGRLILVLLFKHWGIQGNSGRLAWLLANYHDLLKHVSAFDLVLWSVLGFSWIILALMPIANQKITASLAIPLLLLSLLTFSTDDKTRVMAVATFPLLTVLWLLNADFLGAFNKKLTTAIFSIWILVPWIFIWQGSAYFSTFFGNVQGFNGTLNTLKILFGL